MVDSWFYIGRLAILSNKIEFKEFDICLANVPNLKWWNAVVGNYLTVVPYFEKGNKAVNNYYIVRLVILLALLLVRLKNY